MDQLIPYIGVKHLRARPMTLGEYNAYRGWTIPANEDPNRPGYLVVYSPDGYQSWSPKEIFESAYLPLEGDGTKITEPVVRGFMATMKATNMANGKSTLVEAQDRAGFVYIEASSCVDKKNYDPAIGVEVCANRIKDALWRQLGFVLQWGLKGLVPEKVNTRWDGSFDVDVQDEPVPGQDSK